MEVGLAVAGRRRAARTQPAATVASGGFATARGVAYASGAPVVIGTAFFARTLYAKALIRDAHFESDTLWPEGRLTLITSATQKRAGPPTLTRTGNTLC